MPHKNPNADRFGGPGSSRQDRDHPEKGGRQHDRRAPGSPTSRRNPKCLAGVGSVMSTTPTTIVTGADQAELISYLPARLIRP
jgi:hypothetical protein